MKTEKLDTKTEIIGGITTFLTMSYIVIVNPSILSTPGTGLSFTGVLTATVLIGFLMTLLMGLYAKLPFGVAPGLGVNAFFTFTIILGKNIPWKIALGIVFWSGILFLLCSVFQIREAIIKAIPRSLRLSVAVGLGTFLTLIGLKNMGLVVGHPQTLLSMGRIDGNVLLSLMGFGIMIYLFNKKNPFAFIIGISFVTLLAVLTGDVTAPESWFQKPDFHSVFFQLDIWGALKLALVPSIIAIFFTDLFDSLSSFVGVSEATGLLDENNEPKNLKQGLVVDALATLTAGLFGSSSGTVYMESAAGIHVGARGGLAAIVTAVCFLPMFFIAPIAGMVPAYATGPVLVLVGFTMFQTVQKISFVKMEEAIPSFMTIVLIPLTFSITQGILWGFILHTSLFVMAGRRKEIPAMMYTLSLIAVGLLILENVS